MKRRLVSSATLVLACSAEPAPSNPPNAATTGGFSGTGGAIATSGGSPTTGGTAPVAGGVPGTGGSTGGVVSATGGVTSATGGATALPPTGGAAPIASGGTPSATGGTTGTAGASTMVAFSQVMAFIRTQCGTCHTGTTPPNLNTTRGAAALHDTLLTTRVSECAGNPLVTANDPSKSALLMVGMGECGLLKMPAGCTDPICYTIADEALLTNWIRAGAKQ